MPGLQTNTHRPQRTATGAASLDLTFNPGPHADREVQVISEQADKNILIGGLFTRFGEASHRGLDASFTATVGGDVHTLAVQQDGKIVIAGDFSRVNDQPRRRITRLNPDGTLDETFSANAAVNRDIRAVIIQPDGKILIAGNFDLVTGKKQPGIGRFNADGLRDGSFNPGTGASAAVRSLALQPDGKVIAAGDFTTFNQFTCGHLIRLKADGNVDAGFDTGVGADGEIMCVAIQSNGKLLIGGNFIAVNHVERNRVARLNPNGTLDSGFNPAAGPNGAVRCLVVQRNGKILLGGAFTSVQGKARPRLARLNPDGALDATFNPAPGADDVVDWVGTQADGRILIAGRFQKFNGLERPLIARLRGE